MKDNCNHLIWYIPTYDYIEEVYFDSELKFSEWMGLLDKRKSIWKFFDFCPICGMKINRLWMLRNIKATYKYLNK